MPISQERLQEIYDTDIGSPENKGWIAIPDSKDGAIIANAAGSSGGEPGNGWKIHISVEPEKIAQAACLIAQVLNNEDAPRISIKFAGKSLASTGQGSKQIAFIFYQEELPDKEKISAFLGLLSSLFKDNDIGLDSRVINSDREATDTKYDATFLNEQGMPTRYHYRNEQCIVMDDDLYDDVGGSGNTTIQDKQIWVKQSYYLSLPNTQKHNPGACVLDPFEGIRVATSIEGLLGASAATTVLGGWQGYFKPAATRNSESTVESQMTKK